jgi:hypothetical protein
MRPIRHGVGRILEKYIEILPLIDYNVIIALFLQGFFS